jgi:hypothetical protein
MTALEVIIRPLRDVWKEKTLIGKAYPADIGRIDFVFRSLHGARVIKARPWQTGTRLLVAFLWDGVRSEGRVSYCQRKERGGFAIGVELSGQLQAA